MGWIGFCSARPRLSLHTRPNIQRLEFPFDLKVVPERVADKVDGIAVARFKINRVHVIAAGAVNDSADSRPHARESTHTARLQGAVKCESAE